MENPSQEFLEKKAILELKDSINKEEHERKMKELIYARETSQIQHNQTLERGRIFNAEQKKMILLKAQEGRGR